MADPLFVRRDVWTLRANPPWDPATEAYARAVATMQARPPDDPTSWQFQAAVHGSYARPPVGARWNECQHANWFFLPWHRMYLYFFERIVRAAVIGNGGPADFALPYWNYDQPAPRSSLPEPFRVPALPDGTTNPLFLPAPRRNSAIANGAQLSPLVTSSRAALRQTRYDGPPGAGFGGVRRTPAHFGGTFGALEQTPHNDVHVQIGGTPNGPCQGGLMIDPNCAALDPIFWLHHANIDRLWNRWLAQGRRVNPTAPEWLDQSFSFVDETGAVVSMTAADVVDNATQLGYAYDDEPAGVPETVRMRAEMPEEPRSLRPPDMVAASERPIQLKGDRVSVSLAVPASTRERVSPEAFVAPTAAEGPRSVYLNVEDIEAQANPGVVYGVFVNGHHVGNITVFGVESVNDPDKPHESVPGFRHTFDITPLVAEESERGAWNPDAINVTFEPIMPVMPETGIEVASAELSNAAATPIQIGRVSLFVA